MARILSRSTRQERRRVLRREPEVAPVSWSVLGEAATAGETCNQPPPAVSFEFLHPLRVLEPSWTERQIETEGERRTVASHEIRRRRLSLVVHLSSSTCPLSLRLLSALKSLRNQSKQSTNYIPLKIVPFSN